MAGKATIIIDGRMGRDPELRFTPSGAAVANMSVGVSERKKKGDEYVDGPTTWYSVSAWETLGEGVAEHVRKGDRVIVVGTVTDTRTYEKDGGWQAGINVRAESVSVVPRGPEKPKAKEVDTQGDEGDPW